MKLLFLFVCCTLGLTVKSFAFFDDGPSGGYGPPKPQHFSPAVPTNGEGPSGGHGDPSTRSSYLPSFETKTGDGPSGGYGDPVPHNVYSSLNASDLNLWRSSIIHSIEFFNYYAWDAKSQSYASEVGPDGKVLSDKRFILASGRMVYGLAHGSAVVPGYLDLAKKEAAFISAKMIRNDARGPYFLSVVNADGTLPAGVTGNEPLIVNEQGYGLSGLVALYRQSGDPKTLNLIRQLYASFYGRFHDDKNGGFFDQYDLVKGEPESTKTKSFNSIVYVATSFLLELAEADPSRKASYNSTITELADIVSRKFVDHKTGWLIENFDEKWNVDWRGWQKQGEYTVSPVGHNFQAAWFLLRVAKSGMASGAQTLRYIESAQFIINSMLSKPAIDRERGGVYDSFKRETNELMWGSDKAWWQQAEAMLALTQAEKMGLLTDPAALKVRDDALKFYFNHFVAPDALNNPGGEYKTVTATGAPTSDNKGEAGKSTYHTVELARCMMALSQLSKNN